MTANLNRSFQTAVQPSVHLDEKVYGKLINIAGRQRMLSQRIGFLLLTLSRRVDHEEGQSGDLWSMLTTALADFKAGHRVLLNGDPSKDLPRPESIRIMQVLDSGGRIVIDRFLSDVAAFMALLKRDRRPQRDAFEDFSTFVLTDLLQTLQALVMALEADFDDDIKHRRSQRTEETKRVKVAIEDIQKASRLSRLIALNAKIAADRSGPHGKEFGALTEELKNISASISNSSDALLRHLGDI